MRCGACFRERLAAWQDYPNTATIVMRMPQSKPSRTSRDAANYPIRSEKWAQPRMNEEGLSGTSARRGCRVLLKSLQVVAKVEGYRHGAITECSLLLPALLLVLLTRRISCYSRTPLN